MGKKSKKEQNGTMVSRLSGRKSYRDQYDRMMRWLRRLEKVYKGERIIFDGPEVFEDGMVGRSADFHDFEALMNREDTVYAFFQNCYHLKDWLIGDPRFKKLLSKSTIERFVDGNDCLCICADLCNASKHSRISRTRFGGDLDLELSEGAIDHGDEYELIVTQKYEVVSEGLRYDALELAKSCIEKWDEFINKHGLPV